MRPAKKPKAARVGPAASEVNRQRGLDRSAVAAPPQDDEPYCVLCQRQDGRERLFNRYTTEDEAQRVAAALSRVGCPTRVASEADLTLEVQS